MLLVQSEWHLSRTPCPCCGQGLLRFAACTTCCNVVLVCDEVGTVFLNPLAVAAGDDPAPLPDGHQLCPACGAVRLDEYRSATSDEVRALGFGSGDYE